jgi:hypothetical protein
LILRIYVCLEYLVPANDTSRNDQKTKENNVHYRRYHHKSIQITFLRQAMYNNWMSVLHVMKVQQYKLINNLPTNTPIHSVKKANFFVLLTKGNSYIFMSHVSTNTAFFHILTYQHTHTSSSSVEYSKYGDSNW